IRVLMPNWLWFVRLLREDGQLEEAQKALDAIFQRESGQQNLEAQREKLLLMELREDWVKVAEGWQKRLGELRALRGHFQTTLKTKQEALKRAPFDRQEEAQRDVENAERNLKKANELFFESYYHATYSFFKIGKTFKNKNQQMQAQIRQRFIDTAANYTHKLEIDKDQEGWKIIGDQLKHLVNSDPALKMAYQKLK